jgi:hypothetical protein
MTFGAEVSRIRRSAVYFVIESTGGAVDPEDPTASANAGRRRFRRPRHF